MAAWDISAVVSLLLLLLLLISGADTAASVQTDPGDVAVMRALSNALGATSSPLGWIDAADPCTWTRVRCDFGRVTAIQIGNYNLTGTLPTDDGVSLRNLAFLIRLELMFNRISGALPSLSGLGKLTVLYLHNNEFSSFPPGDPGNYFAGLTSLVNVSIGNNPLPSWQIPASLRDASHLVALDANTVNFTGTIPDFFGTAFPSLYRLNLVGNSLTGGIPATLAEAVAMGQLWLTFNDLGGGVDVVSSMTSLQSLFLNVNNFSGPLPDFSKLTNLEVAHLRGNKFTGPVPSSLTSLMSLKEVYLTNNLLQGPVPVFQKPPATLDMNVASERFCLPAPGECDARVNVLLSIAASLGYPSILALNWNGNDPCSGWSGITCDNSKNVSVVNLSNMELSGTISPDYRLLPSLQKLVLSNNKLTGVIPPELTELASLQLFDVSNNSLSGKVPTFNPRVVVHTEGNPDLRPPPIQGSS